LTKRPINNPTTVEANAITSTAFTREDIEKLLTITTMKGAGIGGISTPQKLKELGLDCIFGA
jgi:hypothetical protein